MVSASRKKKIEALQRGQYITVKQPQRAYYDAGTIQPGDMVEVSEACAPYIFRQKGKHECFLAGWWLHDGKQHPCGIDYENVEFIS